MQKQLLKTGHLDEYPYEVFLVGRGKWTAERVKLHYAAIQAFKKVDTPEGGAEAIEWKDKNGNDYDHMNVRFVAGPLVDFILKTSREKAIEGLKKDLIRDAQSRYRNLKSFQAACERHAEKLVDAVRAVAAEYAKKSKVKKK